MRQQEKLSGFTNISIRWSTLNDLSKKPVNGIVIAHEILDALPVEDIMTPRSVMFCLKESDTVGEVINHHSPIAFSRIPIFNKDLATFVPKNPTPIIPKV